MRRNVEIATPLPDLPVKRGIMQGWWCTHGFLSVTQHDAMSPLRSPCIGDDQCNIEGQGEKRLNVIPEGSVYAGFWDGMFRMYLE